MSWTFYADCAEQFAVANLVHEDDQPAVFRATIPGRAVLAVFCDEREQEVVVNPHMLRERATPEAVADAALQARVMEAVADRQRERARLERLFGAN
jgi:UDP-glucose 6-dehydrogenase